MILPKPILARGKCCPHCGGREFTQNKINNDMCICYKCDTHLYYRDLRNIKGVAHENVMHVHTLYFPIESGDYGQTVRKNCARMERAEPKRREDKPAPTYSPIFTLEG